MLGILDAYKETIYKWLEKGDIKIYVWFYYKSESLEITILLLIN